MQEDLYEEDMNKKVRATGMISQLFRATENFEVLLSHETLLQVRMPGASIIFCLYH